MTDGSVRRATSSSLEDPAEVGVNLTGPLRVDVEGVAVTDLGGEVPGVLFTRE